MITKAKELFNSPQSHCFTSAVKRCNMAAQHYVEREFLISGTANIYETGENGRPRVKYADCRYTDRMTLRMPEDGTRASGRVVVEIVNSTANFDIDRVWGESYRYLMRQGDIFIGITSKPNVFAALCRFDAARYGALDWPNPSQEPVPQTDHPPICSGPQNQETGYIWDILTDLPAFLKSGAADNPLHDLTLRRFYLTGWSQSCSYINQFVRSFETAAAHAYDGYLSSGGVHSMLTPLNRYESVLPVDSLDKRLGRAPAPLIELNTESEASDEWGFYGYSAWRPDSDDPDFRYRYRDIAGGCHDAVDTCMAYIAFDDDVTKAVGRIGGGPPGNSFCSNNYQKYFAFHTALRDLYLWSEAGAAPKHFERMRQSSQGKILKDAFGNSLGGLRTPLVDYPVCTFYNWSKLVNPETGEKNVNFLAGHEKAFSPEFLKELYGDLSHYRQLVEADADRLAAEGQILDEDRNDLVAAAVDRALQAGLK